MGKLHAPIGQAGEPTRRGTDGLTQTTGPRRLRPSDDLRLQEREGQRLHRRPERRMCSLPARRLGGMLQLVSGALG